MRSEAGVQGLVVLMSLAGHGFVHLEGRDPIPSEAELLIEAESLRKMLGKEHVVHLSLNDFGVDRVKLADWPVIPEAIQHGLSHLGNVNVRTTETALFQEGLAFKGDLLGTLIRFNTWLISLR